jgi:hypothetical protein
MKKFAFFCFVIMVALSTQSVHSQECYHNGQYPFDIIFCFDGGTATIYLNGEKLNQVPYQKAELKLEGRVLVSKSASFIVVGDSAFSFSSTPWVKLDGGTSEQIQ